MTTDFRALCAELINELHGYKVAHPNHSTELIDAARAALAEEPAVPEGREPTRDELWELWLRLNNEMPDRPAAVAEFWEHACVHARARWGNPAPALPAEGDVAELVEWLMVTAGDEGSFGRVRPTRAAELLQRQALVPEVK